MFFLVFLKWILVLGLLAAGAFFLLTGLGIEIPLIKYKGVEVYGVPAGLVLLAAGVALSYFWKISLRDIERESSETISPDGTVRREERERETFRTLRGKGPEDF